MIVDSRNNRTILLYLLLWIIPLVRHVISVNVTLTTPTFIGGRLMSKCPKIPTGRRNCTFEFWTRGAHYRLYDFDLNSGGEGRMSRQSPWLDPFVEKQLDYFSEPGIRKPFHEFRQKSLEFVDQLAKINSGSLLYTRNPSWARSNANITFPCKRLSGKIRLTVRNDWIRIWFDDRAPVCSPESFCSQELLSYALGGNDIKSTPLRYYSPVTGVFLLENNPADDNYEFIFFDVTGRMVYVRAIFTVKSDGPHPQVVMQVRELRVWSLGVTLPPLDVETEEYKKRFKPYNYIDPVPGLREKLQTGLAEKYDVFNPRAVSIMYTPDINDDEKISFCATSGADPYSEKTSFVCKWAGEDQSKFIPKVQYDSKTLIQSHLIHTYKDGSIFHFVYSLKNDSGSQMMYYFCHTGTPLKPKTEIGGQLTLDGTTKDPICKESVKTSIVAAPSGLTAYNNPSADYKFVCNATIVFYDFFYSIYAYNQPLTVSSKMKLIPEEISNFFMNAVVYLPTFERFYFFTHTNSLLTIKGALLSPCDELKLSRHSIAELWSQDFLIFHSYDPKAGSIGEPLILDYREIGPGDTDTSPGFGLVPSTGDHGKKDNKPSGNGGGSNGGGGGGGGGKVPGKGGSGSNQIVIIIALILGGLIVAGIVYMFCLKGSKTDDFTKRAKSRQSFGKPKVASMKSSDLHAKTIRSSHQISAIGSKKIVSPLKSTKSHKSVSPKKSKSSSKPKSASPRSPRLKSASPKAKSVKSK